MDNHQVFIDGKPVDHEVVIQTELRPRGFYRFLPALLQRFLARWFHVYDRVSMPVDLLPYAPATGSSVVMIYSYGGEPVGAYRVHSEAD